MDTYSDNNSAPPEFPEQSAGSSVSSRFQDEYEELLKYAVVVPKIDVDDLPRVLADSKRSFTRSRKPPTPEEQVHTSESESETEPKYLGTREMSSMVLTTKQGLGRIISPARKQPNRESDITTITPKTKISPSQQYRYQPRARDTEESESDALPNNHGNINRVGGEESETESEGGVMFESTLHQTLTEGGMPSQTDLSEIERKLDMWSRQVNSNIMDEISRLRIKLVETSRHQIQTTQSRHAGEMNALYNELEGVKELLHTYEVSIERKDGVIANLTRALQNQKEKFETLKTFTDWKVQFASSKQEGYAMKLAAQHYNTTLKQRCWKKWHMVIVEKWRRRVEKACQAKAQEVCISLTNDYETKLQSLDEKYMASRDEVLSLHAEREYYEENMKKAFMRGVCALNMEAMNIFQEPDPAGQGGEEWGYSHSAPHSDRENNTPPPPQSDSQATTMPHSKIFSAPSPMGSRSYTIKHEPAYNSASTASTTAPLSQSSLRSIGRKLTATVTANNKPGKPGTARLMSQQPVLVERHDNTSAGDSQSHSQAAGKYHVVSSGSGTKRSGLSSRVVKIVK